ncbi:MAG: nuclear transport factor 2 family protein [Marinoscillum sp.]
MIKPKALVQQWVDLFNAGDAQGLASLYHDDAINHQVANEPIVGKTAIYQMFKSEFAQAEMTCIVEQILEDGEWAILEWKDPLGLRGCGFFQVIEGKIQLQRGYWDKLSFLRQHNLPIPPFPET